MDSSNPVEAAHKLLDDVLTHPLSDDQAIRVAEVLVALAVAERSNTFTAQAKTPVVGTLLPPPDPNFLADPLGVLGGSSKKRVAKENPLAPDYSGEDDELPESKRPRVWVEGDSHDNGHWQYLD